MAGAALDSPFACMPFRISCGELTDICPSLQDGREGHAECHRILAAARFTAWVAARAGRYLACSHRSLVAVARADVTAAAQAARPVA